MQQAAAQETQAEVAGGSMAGHNSIARPTNIGNLQAAMQLEDPCKYRYFRVSTYFVLTTVWVLKLIMSIIDKHCKVCSCRRSQM